MPNHVFVSHVHDDRSHAERICEMIERHGIPCWVCWRDIAPGAMDYGAELARAIRESKAMVVVVSRNTNRSIHVSREIELADEANITVIPLRMEESDLSDALRYRLHNRQNLFAYGAEAGHFERRLLSVLGSRPDANEKNEEPKLPFPDVVTSRRIRNSAMAGLTLVALACAASLLQTRDYEFFDHVREARWTNGSEDIPWQTKGKFEPGVAADASREILEHGKAEPRTIHTHPQWLNDGRVWGEFSIGKAIRQGDRFRTQVGFLGVNHIVGEVDFLIEADGDGLKPRQFGPIHKRHDGQLIPVDIDLTAAAGATRMKLVVSASGSANQDWAVWVDPRLVRKRFW